MRPSEHNRFDASNHIGRRSCSLASCQKGARTANRKTTHPGSIWSMDSELWIVKRDALIWDAVPASSSGAPTTSKQQISRHLRQQGTPYVDRINPCRTTGHPACRPSSHLPDTPPPSRRPDRHPPNTRIPRMHTCFAPAKPSDTPHADPIGTRLRVRHPACRPGSHLPDYPPPHAHT